MTKTYYIYGIFTLPSQINCCADVMGQEFPIVLGNIKGKIIFPSLSKMLNKDTKSEDLLKMIPGPICPIQKNWYNEQDSFGKTDWGQTLTFPDCNSIIDKILLVFDIAENNNSIESEEIYANILNWVDRFYDIKELLTNTISHIKSEKPTVFVKDFGFSSTGLQLYLDKETDLLPIPKESDTKHIITLSMGGNYLNKDTYKEIINLTNKNKDIKFDYKYYLEGKRAFYNEDYIKAVTICAPALEFVLSQSLEAFCKSKGIYFLNKLRKKYRMLGGMFELAEDIKMPLPTSDYKTKLLELRNKVIHKGYKPTINEVNDYLKDIKLYIDTLSPSLLEN